MILGAISSHSMWICIVLHICHYLTYVKRRGFVVILNNNNKSHHSLFTLFFLRETLVIHVFRLFPKLEKVLFGYRFILPFPPPDFPLPLSSATLPLYFLLGCQSTSTLLQCIHGSHQVNQHLSYTEPLN